MKVQVEHEDRLDGSVASAHAATSLRQVIAAPRQSATVRVGDDGRRLARLERSPCRAPGAQEASGAEFTLPPVYPEWLGDRSFNHVHGVRFPYLVGEMARGLTTPAMVIAAARAGLLGFHGSAGLPVPDVERALSTISDALDPDGLPWGANLIHSPQQPDQERALVELFLRKGVRRVSASAFMQLSPDIVHYSAAGLRLEGERIERDTHVFAKVSRAEVAEQFMRPAPASMLQALVAEGRLSSEQASMAARVPVAVDITAEADSGGHTDNRPASVLFGSLVRARARACRSHALDPDAIRIGLAGGIGTPESLAAAFQLGAAYVVTGSINQAACESGVSATARALLARAGPSDVTMAPAADMFEQGVELQVLQRGTGFAVQARRLYRLYVSGACLATLGARDRQWLEGLLGEPLDAAWQQTRDYLQQRDPETLADAERDGNLQLALLCRRYLFMAAQWAREGVEQRRGHYQLWCGPAMGAFNEWVAGTVLEPLENRTVRQIAWNLLEGAARLARASQLRACGVEVPAGAFEYAPRLFDR